MQLIIVTGISGSGKSLAIHVLEDAGYFCIDNLPVRYVLEVALSLEQEGHAKVAMSIDVRVGTRLTGLRDAVRQLRAQGHDVKVLFLNARTDSLVQRYSETLRRHPLTLPGRSNNTSHGADPKLAPTLEESIERERELMAEIEDIGTSIDTSDLHPNTLRQWVRDLVRTDRASMTLLFESFAFKQGVPLDADLVFDVRCLPNPYYDVELRTLTGLDQPVKDFLVDLPPVQKMIGDITRFITEWLPSYVQDNRRPDAGRALRPHRARAGAPPRPGQPPKRHRRHRHADALISSGCRTCPCSQRRIGLGNGAPSSADGTSQRCCSGSGRALASASGAALMPPSAPLAGA